MTSGFHGFLRHLGATDRTPHTWKMACALFALELKRGQLSRETSLELDGSVAF